MSDWLQELSELEHLKASWERRETNSYQPYRKAVLNHAGWLIEHARRAQELERENESRYSDREAFLADANLMVQEKTRIMHEVQKLTTRMPPAALKFMGYALIEAGRNP